MKRTHRISSGCHGLDKEVSSDRGPQWAGEVGRTEAGNLISPDPRNPSLYRLLQLEWRELPSETSHGDKGSICDGKTITGFTFRCQKASRVAYPEA